MWGNEKITAGDLAAACGIIYHEKKVLFLHGSLLESLDEQTPEGLGCGDVGTLDGGVRAAPGGIPSEQQQALQSQEPIKI